MAGVEIAREMNMSVDGDAGPVMLAKVAAGTWLAQALGTFCSLEVPDNMDGECSVESLAEKCGVQEQMMLRLLRTLSVLGVCEQTGKSSFKLTHTGQFCRADHPQSVRGFLLFTTSTYDMKCWMEFEEVMKTGKSSVPKALGLDSYYDIFKTDPIHMKNFEDGMKYFTSSYMDSILKFKIWNSISKLVDVGAGPGVLVMEVLRKHPEMKGVIADIPCVVAGNPPIPEDLQDRCTSAPIDMRDASSLESIRGADGYALKHVIHNWPDAECVKVFENLRQVMAPGGKILVIESGPIPEDNTPHFAKLMDLHMATVLSSKERTVSEYRALFEQAGLTVTGMETTSDIFIMVGEDAQSTSADSK